MYWSFGEGRVVRIVGTGVMGVVLVLRWMCCSRFVSMRCYVEEVWTRKLFFCDELTGERDMHSANELVMCMGDFCGHMGRHIDGFDGIHGGYGEYQRNVDGRML